jgi:hypothetical protein
MMFTIGKDCDLRFTHPRINGGQPCGFLLAHDPSVRGNSISVQRVVEDGVITIRLYFTLILADDLKNHDGSKHEQSRAQMYAMLLKYLGQADALAIDTVVGVFAGMVSSGHSATELHQPDVTHFALQFYNLTDYHPPIDSALYFASCWDAEDIAWEEDMLWR